MAGSRAALFALILAVFIAVDWLLLLRSSSGQDFRDADLVYCLAPARQSGLVNSAEDLGLVDPGSNPSMIRISGSGMSLAAWRSKDHADFRRACSAYAAPAFQSGDSSGQGGGADSLLAVLLQVAAGALLTLVINEIKQGSDRRWVQADALRDSWKAFRGAVDSYIKERQNGLASQDEIDALRRDLVTRLRTILSQHRRSPTVARLKNQLGADLGSDVAKNWATGNDEGASRERARRAATITDCLDNFDTSLQKVAGKLQHGIWLSWRL